MKHNPSPYFVLLLSVLIGAGIWQWKMESRAAEVQAAQSSSSVQPADVNVCGNGAIGANEDCDDKNTKDLDGCSSKCKLELGWICWGMPSKCQSICGNGFRSGSEECDDGNYFEGDGCSNCKLEAFMFPKALEPPAPAKHPAPLLRQGQAQFIEETGFFVSFLRASPLYSILAATIAIMMVIMGLTIISKWGRERKLLRVLAMQMKQSAENVTCPAQTTSPVPAPAAQPTPGAPTPPAEGH